MVNISKIGTKAMSGVKLDSLIKYAKTPKQFKFSEETFGNALLKVKEETPYDSFMKAFGAKKVSEPLTEISPELAKKPPLWKWAIGKIFG